MLGPVTTSEIADEFDAALAELVDLIGPATPEQWRMAGRNNPDIDLGEDERRPVATIVHHVARSLLLIPERGRAWIRGEDPPLPTDANNAEHAAANPDPDKEETLRYLERNANGYREFVAGLSDSDLQATGTWMSGPRTLDTLLGRVVPFHMRWHAGSIRATWHRPAD
jgi:DinB family protein